jgi:hypothetical protein
MKWVRVPLMAAMVAASLAACSNSPRRDDAAEPDVTVTPYHKTMLAGETIAVMARTANLVGSSPLRWTVTPTTAQITPQGNGLMAMFTANEPGTYLITVSADAGNGRWVQSSANVTVNGLMLNGRDLHQNNTNMNNMNNQPVDRNGNPVPR